MRLTFKCVACTNENHKILDDRYKLECYKPNIDGIKNEVGDNR